MQGSIPRDGWGERAMDIPDLSPEEKVLVIIRDELYDGSWEEMVEDLRARLQSRPYVLKLTSRIETDIERIERMREIERNREINLADYVEGS
jgi:hypothetical protein